MHKQSIRISALVTFAILSLASYRLIFVESNVSDDKLKIVAIISVLSSIFLMIKKDPKHQAIGRGILYGTIFCAIIFSIIMICVLANAFSNHMEN